jgi:hypothetical protein
VNIKLLSPNWAAPTDISTNLGFTYRKYTTTITSILRLAHTRWHKHTHTLTSISHSLYLVEPVTPLNLEIFIQAVIPLKPDARLTHQHGMRNKKMDLHNDTPTATATYHLALPHGHNIGPPWLSTTPSHWQISTLRGPRGHTEPTDPYLQWMNCH